MGWGVHASPLRHFVHDTILYWEEIPRATVAGYFQLISKDKHWPFKPGRFSLLVIMFVERCKSLSRSWNPWLHRLHKLESPELEALWSRMMGDILWYWIAHAQECLSSSLTNPSFWHDLWWAKHVYLTRSRPRNFRVNCFLTTVNFSLLESSLHKLWSYSSGYTTEVTHQIEQSPSYE